MIKTANASKVIGLLLVLMAALVVLSGPVAGLADLPEPTAEAKKKKKKKKKKRPPVVTPAPAYNVVQCPNSLDDSYNCVGTPGSDYLVGGPASRSPHGTYDYMEGRDGNDVYNGGDGADYIADSGATSNDSYLFPSTEFGLSNDGSSSEVFIQDFGGNADVLDLGSYKSTDFAQLARNERSDLFLDGPGARHIYIYRFFMENSSVESFKFSDRTVTADEIKKELS